MFMQLLLYSAFWCPDCRTAKRFLEKNNIPITEVDIESTPGAGTTVRIRMPAEYGAAPELGSTRQVS